MNTPTPARVVNAKHKHHIANSDGSGFWLTCDRPFDEAATDMLRSAIHAYKPVPSVLGNKRRIPTPAPVAA